MMNIVDLAILLAIFVPALIGIWCGAVSIAVFELTWGLAGYCSWNYRHLLVPFYSSLTANETLQIIASVCTLLIVIVIVGTVLGGFIKVFIKSIGLGPLDRVLGLALGGLAGVALVTAVVFVGKKSGLSDQEDWKNSIMLPYFDKLSDDVTDWVKKEGIEMPKIDMSLPQAPQVPQLPENTQDSKELENLLQGLQNPQHSQNPQNPSNPQQQGQ